MKEPNEPPNYRGTGTAVEAGAELEPKKAKPKKTVVVPQKEPLPPWANTAGGVALLGLLVFLGVYVSLTALVVVLGLVFMIVLHELGHFATAKLTGMKASEFFIGFGPRIWSFRKGETEYGARILPLGAYVRIAGMSSLEEIPAAEEHRTYRFKPYRSRLLVAVAGSAMHFILAMAVLWTLFSAIGHYPINQQLDPDEAFASWEITSVVEDSPAERAGFRSDDRIVAAQVPGLVRQDLATYGETVDFIEQHPNQDVVFFVYRGGQEVLLDTTIGVGELPSDPTKVRGRLGISSQRIDPVDPPKSSVIGGLGDAAVEFGQLTKLLVQDLARVFSPSGFANLFSQIFGGDSATSVDDPDFSVDDSRIVSIYGVGRLATDLGDGGEWATLLFLYAAINIFIGMFNLIPLPPFDGGHVAVATYERLRSRRGQPYRIDAAKLIPLQYAVLAVFIVIGVAALYLDVVDPIGLS